MSVSSLHAQICFKCHTESTHCACWSLSGGSGGLLVCQLQNPSLATEKESRLLLYQNLESDLDNLSCTEKVAKAQFASKNPVWMQYCHQNISILLCVWSLLTHSSTPPPTSFHSLFKCWRTQPNNPSSVFTYSLEGCLCWQVHVPGKDLPSWLCLNVWSLWMWEK